VTESPAAAVNRYSRANDAGRPGAPQSRAVSESATVVPAVSGVTVQPVMRNSIGSSTGSAAGPVSANASVS